MAERASAAFFEDEAMFLKVAAPMRVADGGNNLDVAVVIRLLNELGVRARFLDDLTDSMRVFGDAENGTCFIINTDSHYVCVCKREGVWIYHDSLVSAPEVWSTQVVKAVLVATAAGNKRGKHGRRVIFFKLRFV